MTKNNKNNALRNKILSVLCLSIILLTISSTTLASKKPKHIRAQIQKLSRQIEKKRSALKGIDGQEKILFLELSQLEHELYRLNKETEKKNQQIRVLQDKKKILTKTLKQQKQEIVSTLKKIRYRLRLIYVNGQSSGNHSIQNKESFLHYALHNHYLQKQEKADLIIFKKLKKQQTTLQNSQIGYDRLLSTLKKASNEYKKNQATLLDGKKTKEMLLKSLDKKQAHLLEAVKIAVQAQKKAQKELFKLIKEIPVNKRYQGKGVLAKSILKPVKGKIFRKFGVTRDKESGARILNKGVSFKAKVGEAVVSPISGKVVYSGWMRGFGLILLIDGGSKTHILLAHLSKSLVKNGDTIKRGDTIALAGDSESLEGPQVYMELRKYSKAINPKRYFR